MIVLFDKSVTVRHIKLKHDPMFSETETGLQVFTYKEFLLEFWCITNIK